MHQLIITAYRYVAVCGLPKANPDHAVVMARFGALCLAKFAQLAQALEVRLGPSTGDLQARVGLHSGPVVAGVLRGAKARFQVSLGVSQQSCSDDNRYQLFGDTVNTAARLESTSWPMHIHASKATVDLLVQAGKAGWSIQRDDIAVMKGKASAKTYWINPEHKDRYRVEGNPRLGQDQQQAQETAIVIYQSSERKQMLRLVEWNVAVLYNLLQSLVAMRQSHTFENGIEPKLVSKHDSATVLHEAASVLELPKFDPALRRKVAKGSIHIPQVRDQLYEFVLEIAMSYQDVPFHNFDHASHVVMSANTLMKRVVEPDDIDFSKPDAEGKMHQSTYGISSDPLMRFTAMFSSLIHDCDHTGLTNQELKQTDAPVSQKYQHKSSAEQNSIVKAWDILCESRFTALRACIYTNTAELHRFRQLLVNAVISTDLADKELQQKRQSRWEAAFLTEFDSPLSELSSLEANRRATVIYEYIIQAADVAHTMQHWNTYQKFNRRLFEERYLAWVKGHSPSEPTEGWYGGELSFFDFYIIPLAKKLNTCGVFGASYDALVTYALENRKEWEQKGKSVVASMQNLCLQKYGTAENPMAGVLTTSTESTSFDNNYAYI